MINAPEESFHHIAECISRLHRALETLQDIKSSAPDQPLISPAFRFALIEYATPFNSSHGQHKQRDNQESYKLDAAKYVPSRHFALHKRILDARNQVHAHTDLTLLNARNFKATGNKKDPAAYLECDYSDEMKELPNIDQIIDLITELIHKMYVERDARLKALNP